MIALTLIGRYGWRVLLIGASLALFGATVWGVVNTVARAFG